MPRHKFHYITEPLKSLMFTLSADSGLWNIFSIYPRETKCLSVRDKIIIVNLEKKFYAYKYNQLYGFASW